MYYGNGYGYELEPGEKAYNIFARITFKIVLCWCWVLAITMAIRWSTRLLIARANIIYCACSFTAPSSFARSSDHIHKIRFTVQVLSCMAWCGPGADNAIVIVF